MRRSELVAIAVAIAACGCGAKSALEVLPRAPVDAAPPAIDAALDTLPCRWTAGRSIPLGELGPAPFARMAGAADAPREVFALRGERDDGWIDPAFLLGPGDPPRLLSDVAPVAEPPLARSYFARPGGWLEIASSERACEARWRDASFAMVRADRVAESACSADALGRARIALLVPAPEAGTGRWRLSTLSLEEPGAAPVARTVTPTPSIVPPRATLARDGTIFVVWTSAVTFEVDALALLPDGSEVIARALTPGSGAAPRLAPDPLVGGAAVLSRGSGGWRLDRLGVAGATLALSPLLDLAALGDRVPLDVELVTNETEALFALDDGTIAYVPLAGPDLRTIDAPEGGAARARVVLAEGTSLGGLLWSDAPSGGRQLFFRSLVCNR